MLVSHAVVPPPWWLAPCLPATRLPLARGPLRPSPERDTARQIREPIQSGSARVMKSPAWTILPSQMSGAPPIGLVANALAGPSVAPSTGLPHGPERLFPVRLKGRDHERHDPSISRPHSPQRRNPGGVRLAYRRDFRPSTTAVPRVQSEPARRGLDLRARRSGFWGAGAGIAPPRHWRPKRIGRRRSSCVCVHAYRINQRLPTREPILDLDVRAYRIYLHTREW